MPDEPVTPTVTNADDAKAFLEFEYVEVKELTKQFLTVVAAVLAVSVTFSDKIVNFAQSDRTPRVLMMVTWGLCLAAFLLGGLAIYLIFNAGLLAKETVLRGDLGVFWRLTRQQLTERSYLCLNIAGGSFVGALILLVITGFLRAL